MLAQDWFWIMWVVLGIGRIPQYFPQIRGKRMNIRIKIIQFNISAKKYVSKYRESSFNNTRFNYYIIISFQWKYTHIHLKLVQTCKV